MAHHPSQASSTCQAATAASTPPNTLGTGLLLQTDQATATQHTRGKLCTSPTHPEPQYPPTISCALGVGCYHPHQAWAGSHLAGQAPAHTSTAYRPRTLHCQTPQKPQGHGDAHVTCTSRTHSGQTTALLPTYTPIILAQKTAQLQDRPWRCPKNDCQTINHAARGGGTGLTPSSKCTGRCSRPKRLSCAGATTTKAANRSRTHALRTAALQINSAAARVTGAHNSAQETRAHNCAVVQTVYLLRTNSTLSHHKQTTPNKQLCVATQHTNITMITQPCVPRWARTPGCYCCCCASVSCAAAAAASPGPAASASRHPA